MLKVLRKKGVMKKLLWVVAVVIILSFGFLGQAYLLDNPGGQNYAGKIFGKKISLDEYEYHFQHTRIQALMQYGDKFNQIRDFINLEAQAWDRIILSREVQKRKIKVADEDVIKTIKSYGFFRRDNEFDTLLYNDILRHVFKIKTRDFEEGVRDSLKFAKLFEEETRFISVPENEIFDAYKQENEKVQISYILFAPDTYKNQVSLDETQAENYYSDHKEEFLLPEMINVEYTRIDYPKPDDAETQDQEAETPNESQEPSAEDKEAVQSLAMKIMDELNSNPDLNQVAQNHGLTVESSGFFSMEQPNLQPGWTFPLIQKIFQLNVGESAIPIETSLGFQVLRVKEKKEAHIPEYNEAKEKVALTWTMKEARTLAKQKAEENLGVIKETFQSLKRPDFAQIAKDNGLELFQTPVFSRGQYLPTIGLAKDFQDVSFSLSEENKLSEMVETEVGYCILYLDSIVPVDMQDYDKSKEEYQQKLVEEKRNATFGNFITHLRLKANLEDNIAKLAAQQKAENNSP